jgi:uncharacterized damage-inducible protein DinB
MLTQEQAKSMAAMMLQGIAQEATTTRKVIAAIPQEQIGFKLGEKGWTAGKLAWHIVGSEIWFAQSLIDGKFGMEEPPSEPASIEEILKVYDNTVPELTKKVGELSAEQLLLPLNFFNVMTMPAVMFLGFWNNHSIHHRGYLAAYLRAMNAHVPSIYGGSADEPFQMPAETAAAGQS